MVAVHDAGYYSKALTRPSGCATFSRSSAESCAPGAAPARSNHVADCFLSATFSLPPPKMTHSSRTTTQVAHNWVFGKKTGCEKWPVVLAAGDVKELLNPKKSSPYPHKNFPWYRPRSDDCKIHFLLLPQLRVHIFMYIYFAFAEILKRFETMIFTGSFPR